MPYLENDRITVTDPESVYYGEFGTVVWYWSGLECPVVDVKVDGFSVPVKLNDTAIALGEFVVRPLPEYEYNIRVKGKIFYTIWSTEKQLIDLWDVSTLDEVRTRLLLFEPGSNIVRRLKSEIEDI